MEYGALMRRSWLLTWRNRFLWVFGLFAPSSAGSCSGSARGGESIDFGNRGGGPEQLPPALNRAFTEVGQWVIQHLGLVVLAIGVLPLLGLAFLVVSLIAQGGITRATADLALGRPTGLGEAWRAGLGLFWRFLGLWLAALGVVAAGGLSVGAVALVGFLLAQASGGALGPVLIVLGVLLGLVLIVVAVPFFIALSVVVSFAQRAIVLEEAGPLAAMRVSLRLVLRSFGTSFLLWLLSLALGIGAGLAVLLMMLVLLVPLAGIRAMLFFASGASGTLIAYAAAAVLAVIFFAWLLSALPNTFFWGYWTLAYLRLTGRLESLGTE
jgi:hypothetical protein